MYNVWKSIEKLINIRIDKKLAERKFGKYRGIVRDNIDPEEMGRIKIEVPQIYGVAKFKNQLSSWALPSVPYAGKDVGTWFVPKIGDVVWVEFERGDISKPVWSGMLWAKDDMSENMDTPAGNVIETTNFYIAMKDEEDNISFTIKSKTTDREIFVDDTNELIKITGGENVIKLNAEGIDINTNGTNKKVTIQGGDTFLATKEFTDWVKTHQHVGNMGAPTPLFPADLGSFMVGTAPGGGYLTNTINKETKVGT